MKLRNLIDVADKSVTFMLTDIQANGKEVGYNFVTKSWMDNDLYTPERIQRIENFRNTRFFRGIRDKKIENFFIFMASSSETLRNSGIEFYEDKVLKIVIFLSDSKSEIKKAMDAKIDILVSKKQIPTHRQPKKQTYRKKKNWSYANRTPVIEGESQKKNHEERLS